MCFKKTRFFLSLCVIPFFSLSSAIAGNNSGKCKTPAISIPEEVKVFVETEIEAARSEIGTEILTLKAQIQELRVQNEELKEKVREYDAIFIKFQDALSSAD